MFLLNRPKAGGTGVADFQRLVTLICLQLTLLRREQYEVSGLAIFKRTRVSHSTMASLGAALSAPAL